MLTKKQNLLETIRGGKPDRYVNQYEALAMVVMNPYMAHNPQAEYGKGPVKNAWGVTNVWPEGTPGGFPVHDEEHIVCKDITHWKDYVHAPSLDYSDADWEPFVKEAEKIDRNEYFVTQFIAPGIFEQCHHLQEIQNCLMNFYEEPEAMHELVDAIAQWRFHWMQLLVDHLHPDIICSHDDWGSKTSLFMSPEVWREFFKPRYKKIYDYFKSQGVIILHHSDSYCQPIVQDMVDVGIDVWQGVLPQNDIPAIQKEVGGKLILMGGLDAAIMDHKDYDEKVIREEVDRACREYAPGGSFIPCLTYGGEGSIFPGVNDIIMDEIRKQSPLYFH